MRSLLLLLCLLGAAAAFCPSQCTCVFHGRTDGTGSRSVLCNDPDMSDIPVNVPLDTVKLRVEKTAVRKIPTEAFYYLSELRFLWVTYNSVSTVDTGAFYNLKVLHELRLDGNSIALFPWEALREMPSLRTLDLHNNRLTVVPPEAVSYLVNITYLDLSSNKLSTLPSDLMNLWPPFNKAPLSNTSQKVVLGLQDNPWFCDCKLSKVMEVSRLSECPVVLMDLFLTCAAPEPLAGVLFQRAELENCVKPSIMSSATRITSPQGSNVLLRCDASGLPTPALSWQRPDGSAVDNTVEESPGDGVRWSIMSLTGILNTDSGNYSCRAKNEAGETEASVFVSVTATLTTPVAPSRPSPGTGPPDQDEGTTLNTAAAVDVSKPSSPTPSLLPPVVLTRAPPATSTSVQKDSLRPEKVKQGGKRLAADQKSSKKDPASALTDLEVVEESMDSAVLLWTADGLPADTPVTVVYSPYGDEDFKQTMDSSAGSMSSRDPCVDFYTLDRADNSGQNQLFVIISGMVCVLILPLIALLIYKILALYCKGAQIPEDEEELEKESYVKKWGSLRDTFERGEKGEGQRSASAIGTISPYPTTSNTGSKVEMETDMSPETALLPLPCLWR
uniref:Ig-like domain-containing protein n=1 Tax=Knipowitschia caucasica TaxID=637954 RepID=A0AAV2MII7_KNICA